MGVSTEEYRQRIGRFVRVLSSFNVRGNNSNIFQKQSKDYGTALQIITRRSCLVLLVAAVIQNSSLVLDLTQFGDVEKNPGPNSGIPKTSFKTFSNQEFNFLKFASIVLDEFPEALRQIFVDMWNKRIAPLHGNQVWDDSVGARNLLLNLEGEPRTKIPQNSSFQDWGFTVLFQAILHARTFALPDSMGNMKTLYELYLRDRKPVPDPFHSPVASLSGDPNETIALAIDQLQRLRDTICHSSSSQVDRVTFDDYVKYSKEAFTLLHLSTKSLETNLDEYDFTTVPAFEELKERILMGRNDFYQLVGEELQFLREEIAVVIERTDSKRRETQELVQETVKSGKKKNNRISVLFIGQAGVGKTSLKKSLLGKNSEDKESSTVGIEFDVIEVKDNNKREAWQHAADKQYIASEEYKNLVLGKEVARKITENPRSKQSLTMRNERLKETWNGSGWEAVTVDESESVDKDTRGDGADMDSKSQNYDKGNNDNSLSEDLKRTIKENVENYSEDAMDTIRFLFGDTGGQSVFYDIHSIMLRSPSLFIFVFDLERGIDDKVQSSFVCEKTKEERVIKNHLEETNLDYVKKWVGALGNLDSQRGKKREDEKETGKNDKTGENPARSSNMPKTILVFTKPDNLGIEKVEEVRQKAEKAIFTSFGDKNLIVGTYVIKNTLPRNEAETLQLEDLREKIFETAQENLKAQEKTPMSWLELERAFSDRLMKSKDNPCIEYDKAKELAQEFEVNETFREAMKFFHEENIVVHFDGDQPSSNLVVLDPAWLVKILTQVITVPPAPTSGGAVKGPWFDLQTKGVLRSENLPVVLEGHDQKEALMHMMVRAGLMCHWKEDIYFVPNMVTERIGEPKIQKILLGCLQPLLYIDFLGYCIPLGFYTKFLLEFIKWSDIEKFPCGYCNFNRITKKEFDVILIRRITRIQVAILAKEWGNIAKSVVSFVRDTMEVIRSTYPNYHGMRFKVGLKCDLCCEETTPCSRHQKEGCTDDDCVCILSLPHLLTEFPTCERNQFNQRRFSKLTKSSWAQAEGETSFSAANVKLLEDKMSSSQQVTGTTRNNYGDPPQLSVTIPELKNVNPEFKSWESVELLTDILLLVVTDEELLSCYAFLRGVFRSHISELGLVYFGQIGDDLNKVTISLVRSSRGSTNVSAAQNVVRTAVDVLKPKAVFSVGCCAGLKREQTQLGDVVISKTLITCGDKKMVHDKLQFGDKRLDVSAKIGRLITSAADGWKPPLKDPAARRINVFRDGEILSGIEFTNCPGVCEELIRGFPEVIAIESEGQGVYSAAFDLQMEWVVIKGISHYADDGEPEKKWQQFASVMAASVVNNIIKEPDVLKHWPHYEGRKRTQIDSDQEKVENEKKKIRNWKW